MRTSDIAPLIVAAAAAAAFCGPDACVKALAGAHDVLLVSFAQGLIAAPAIIGARLLIAWDGRRVRRPA